MQPIILIAFAVGALFIFIVCIVVFRFFNFWLRARLANAPVGLFKMFGMSLRKVPVGMIVDNRITAVKAGLDTPSDPLEAHYLAGGDVNQVILALIAADKAGISLDFNRACAIDLATKGTGKTVLEAVRTSINPKVIDVPNPSMGRQTIDGVAKDGIGAKVKARVTVRSHLDRFVGGATEDLGVKTTAIRAIGGVRLSVQADCNQVVFDLDDFGGHPGLLHAIIRRR